MKVVLVWTDAPAVTGLMNNYTSDHTATPLVNDLDLSVQIGSPCSARYIGNVLEVTDETKGETSHSYGCSDTVPYDSANNVELVRFFAAGDTSFTVSVNRQSGNSSSQDFALVVYNAYDPLASLTTPRALDAAATDSTTVSLHWTSATIPASFEIWESSGGQAFSLLGTSTNTSFTHSGATSNTAHLYKVRAKAADGSSYSGFSNIDPAVTMSFTDDPATPGNTPIKATHIFELRQGVNYLGAAVGLSPATFTDATLTPGTTIVKAIHLSELRVALNEARTMFALPPVIFVDDPLGIGITTVTVNHIQQLRSGLK
ncbi:MAG TPA: hypothetical protein VER58_03075 [Thermoanaerobaculia bacterium]|nr:hypothetical protein [Thermoanaerobaculia bacterium]